MDGPESLSFERLAALGNCWGNNGTSIKSPESPQPGHRYGHLRSNPSSIQVGRRFALASYLHSIKHKTSTTAIEFLFTVALWPAFAILVETP